jgi:hypothetical protein
VVDLAEHEVAGKQELLGRVKAAALAPQHWKRLRVSFVLLARRLRYHAESIDQSVVIEAAVLDACVEGVAQ